MVSLCQNLALSLDQGLDGLWEVNEVFLELVHWALDGVPMMSHGLAAFWWVVEKLEVGKWM